MKSRVLFLCTGNSCRSQMAEAWLRHYGDAQYEAHSAGTAPQPLHPLALQVMGERGMSLEGQRSKSVSEYSGQRFDWLITVCDAAAEACPRGVFDTTQHLHWSFDDPASFSGSEHERLAKFREVRDEIEAAVTLWLRQASDS